MDNNDKISKIPVSELTPENINTLKKESGIDEPIRSEKPSRERTSNHRLILVIVSAILLVGVGIALYFIFRQPATENPPEEQQGDVEITWKASDESENPAQDYVDDRRAIIDNPDATDDEKLNAELSIANLYSVTDRYEEAESLLNNISRDNLSYRQLFNLYSAYQYLYEQSGNQASYDEYSNLLRDISSIDWKEGETVPPNETGE